MWGVSDSKDRVSFTKDNMPQILQRIKGTGEKSLLDLTIRKNIHKFSQSEFTGMRERKPSCSRLKMESPLWYTLCIDICARENGANTYLDKPLLHFTLSYIFFFLYFQLQNSSKALNLLKWAQPMTRGEGTASCPYKYLLLRSRKVDDEGLFIFIIAQPTLSKVLMTRLIKQ